MITVVLMGWVYYLNSKVYPYQSEFYTALSNFTYQSEEVNHHTLYTHYDKPFVGDCEDFAFTLQYKIGGQVWVVEHNEVSFHAVLDKDGYIYDNFYQRPMKREDFPNKFIAVLSFRGDIVDNG